MAKSKKLKKPIPLSLRAIYLRSANQSIDDNFDPNLPGQSLFGAFKVDGQRILLQESKLTNPESVGVEPMTLNTCVYITSFSFKYDQEIPEELRSDPELHIRTVVTISADIAVDYLRTTDEELDANWLQIWGSHTVMLQAWPYWRQFCQSALANMGLPPSVMPLYEIDLEDK